MRLVRYFAARITTGKFDHVTPYSQELAWLPVKDQIQYIQKAVDDLEMYQ